MVSDSDPYMRRELGISDSGNGLSWTNPDFLLVETLGLNFSTIFSKLLSFMKLHLKCLEIKVLSGLFFNKNTMKYK